MKPTDYASQKTAWIMSLRQDDQIQELSAERDMRDFLGRLELYVQLANQARFAEYHRATKQENPVHNIRNALRPILEGTKSAVGEPTEHNEILDSVNRLTVLFDELKRPRVIEPTFSDLGDIAYSAVMEKRGVVECSLASRIKEATQRYAVLVEQRFLDSGFRFSDDVWDHVRVAFDDQRAIEDRRMAWDGIMSGAAHYVNREVILLELTAAQYDIRDASTSKNWGNLKRGLKGDWSWATAMWKDTGLGITERKTLAQCFQHQSEICGIMFEALYLCAMQLSDRQGRQSHDIARENHEELIKIYRDKGFKSASFSYNPTS